MPGPVRTSLALSCVFAIALVATAAAVRQHQPDDRITGLRVGEMAPVDGLEVTVKAIDALTPRLTQAVAGGEVDVGMRGFRVVVGVRNPGPGPRALGPLVKRFQVVQVDGGRPPGAEVRSPFTSSALLTAEGRALYRRVPASVGPGEKVTGVLLAIVPKWAIVGGCLWVGPDGPAWTLAPGPNQRHL